MEEQTVPMLDKMRNHFDDWPYRGYEERPDWFDAEIEERINALTNVELLALMEILK